MAPANNPVLSSILRQKLLLQLFFNIQWWDVLSSLEMVDIASEKGSLSLEWLVRFLLSLQHVLDPILAPLTLHLLEVRRLLFRLLKLGLEADWLIVNGQGKKDARKQNTKNQPNYWLSHLITRDTTVSYNCLTPSQPMFNQGAIVCLSRSCQNNRTTVLTYNIYNL